MIGSTRSFIIVIIIIIIITVVVVIIIIIPPSASGFWLSVSAACSIFAEHLTADNPSVLH